MHGKMFFYIDMYNQLYSSVVGESINGSECVPVLLNTMKVYYSVNKKTNNQHFIKNVTPQKITRSVGI